MPIKQKAKQEKTYNEGNLAEGVLGAAIVAKICMRQPSGAIGRVTSTEVKKMLQMMVKVPFLAKGGKKTQIKLDSGGSSRDRITFYLNLGAAATAELRRITDLSILNRICDAAASYANSKAMCGLAEQMYNNQINNKVEIDVDGISGNVVTKADLEVWTDSFLFSKISLKAGKDHQLGQVGGNTWLSVLRLFYEGFNPTTKKKEVGLGLKINTAPNEKKYMTLITGNPSFGTVRAAVQWAYTLADDLFNSTPQSTSAKAVYKFLDFHSTRGDTDVKIVMLHLGKHRMFDPLKLEDALKGAKMKSVTRMDTSWPVFLVYDSSMGTIPSTKTSASVLFTIRPKIDARNPGYISHIIEEGPRFYDIIEDKDQ